MQTKYEKVAGGKIVVKFTLDDKGNVIGQPIALTAAAVKQATDRQKNVAGELENIGKMFTSK